MSCPGTSSDPEVDVNRLLQTVAALASAALALAPVAAPALAAPGSEAAAAPGTAAAPAAPATATPEASATPAEGSGALGTLNVTTLTPWLDADGTLTVSGTLTAARDLEKPRLDLRMSQRHYDSREALSSWTNGSGSSTSLAQAAAKPVVPKVDTTADDSKKKSAKKKKPKAEVAQLPAELPAGRSVPFSFSLPAGALPLSATDPLREWGVRGLSLDLSSQGSTDSADSQGQADDTGAEDSADEGLDADGVQRLRTFTTWYPRPKIDATRLGTILPVTLPRFGRNGLIDPAELEAQAADSGNLASLLAGMKTNPSAVLAADPRLLLSVYAALRPAMEAKTAAGAADAKAGTSALGGAETVNPVTVKSLTQAPKDDPYPRLRSWWRQFTQATAGHEVIALPWADADSQVLDRAGLRKQSEVAAHERKLVTDFLPGARTDVTWPRAGSLDYEGLHGLLRTKGLPIVDGTQAAADEPYTVNARSTVTLHPGQSVSRGADPITRKNVLALDTELDGLAERVAGGASPALSRARLAAETAALAGERPFSRRTVLMSMPRTAATTSWAEVGTLMTNLPWLEHTGLADVAKADPAERTAVPARSADTAAAKDGAAAEDDADAADADTDAAATDAATGTDTTPLDTVKQEGERLAPLRATVARGRAFSALFVDPSTARTRNDRIVLGCAAVGWDVASTRTAARQAVAARPAGQATAGAAGGADGAATAQTTPGAEDATAAQPQDRDACVTATQERLRGLEDGLHVEKSSSVLLVTGDKTTIPVRVENSTDLPIEFMVALTGQGPALQTDRSEPTRLDPDETARVEVPVEGIANADVMADVRILATDGTEVGQRPAINVRVRADWENIGTAVIGAGLLAVFVFGLVRAVRKGKRKLPDDQLDAALARGQEHDKG
jgi:hypothetical protein